MLYAPGRLLSPIAGGVPPTLDLNFLGGSMPAGITFTRASTSWYWNSAGTLTSATTNTPRLDYDPVTLAAKGLLIEEARTNLVPGTMTGGTYWTALGTVIASGQTAPDGTTNAVLLTENASGTTSYGGNLVTPVTITASTATTASIFAKAGTGTWFRIILADATTPTIGAQAYFNLGTGTVGTVGTQSGAPTGVSATITNVGNGWRRCTLTATLGAATTGTMLLRMTSADATTTDTGSKTMSLFAPQLEVGGFASSPVITTTAAATRALELATITPLGAWYNSAEGSMIVEVETPSQTSLSTTGVSFGFSDTTFNNALYLSHSTSGDILTVNNGGVSQASISNATPPLTVKKIAGAYKVNDFAFVRNGGAVSTDASGSVSPVATQARIGSASWGAGGNYLNGYIRRVKIYDRRLPNATLQVLTS